MKIKVLCIGQIAANVAGRIKENLNMIFTDATFTLVTEKLQVADEAFDSERQQYRSDAILSRIHNYAEKENASTVILGVLDVDMFVPELSFVFGQAECPGKAALISLWRLRPEFYGKPPNMELLVERSAKEAMHELGHVLGLPHCSNPFCVMYFSNSIFETDRKQSLFCNKCHLKSETAINKLGEQHS